MSMHVVIPARYQSSRLPGKPLLEIAGKTMIQHVYERVKNCGAKNVIIATDDERIFQVAKSFEAEVCMTSQAHPTGTDRLAEVAEKFVLADDDIVVNVQGDEPLIAVANVKQVAENLELHQQASIATLCEICHSEQEILDPNVVKVVKDKQGYALYFSRAPIAWQKDFSDSQKHFYHIGLYAYRVKFLKQYVEWGKCDLERMESLEQLRALWHGAKIHVDLAKESSSFGVDTSEDLQKITRLMQNG